MPDPKVVHVEIQGQRYPIRTTLEPKYVQDLATYVDRKMALAADASPSSDTLGLAVLTALNIADEFFRIRHQQRDEVGTLAERAEALERIVDQALELVGNPEKSS
jgi:cell division protein ZapA